MLLKSKLWARALACVLLVICFGAGTVCAQVTATISGKVEDSTGAAIPGASITVTSLETGAARTTTVGETGTYRVLSLPVGRYEVKAELTGFKAALQTGITLAVGEEAVVNLKLEVGATQEEVTITGEAPIINTTTASVSGLVGEREVKDLPLNGRSFDNLITLNPGAVLYNFKDTDMKWVEYRPKAKMHVLHHIFHEGIQVPDYFFGKNIVHLPTVKCHIYTTTTGAMKNAFGGLLNEHRHWTHPVIHETLVDLLMIQKKIHRGVFAVMDGTFAGDGPGPRCMMPHTKNVILASEDQVAIDAVAAKLMGFDPMQIKYIRMAHDLGLGCGDPREIEIAGDQSAANENWHFVGPFKKMTFASRMQHKIYWGPMKRPVEWSLKTVLAPWAYIASVVYHDSFWYPVNAKRMMRQVLDSPWGHLFRNWERVTPDANGYPEVGGAAAELTLTGGRALVRSLGILGTCIAEATEILSRRMRQARGGDRRETIKESGHV